eukprot:366423-Chlamydomonas_euryale.AAC.4
MRGCWAELPDNSPRADHALSPAWPSSGTYTPTPTPTPTPCMHARLACGTGFPACALDPHLFIFQPASKAKHVLDRPSRAASEPVAWQDVTKGHTWGCVTWRGSCKELTSGGESANTA